MTKLLAGIKFLLIFLNFCLNIHDDPAFFSLQNSSTSLKENQETLNENYQISSNFSKSVRKLQTPDQICSQFISCQECFSNNGCVFSGGICTYYMSPPTNA